MHRTGVGMPQRPGGFDQPSAPGCPSVRPTGARTTTVLLALYSLICLMVHRWRDQWPALAHSIAWYLKPHATLSYGLALVRRTICRGEFRQLNIRPECPDYFPAGLGTLARSTGLDGLKWPKSSSNSLIDLNGAQSGEILLNSGFSKDAILTITHIFPPQGHAGRRAQMLITADRSLPHPPQRPSQYQVGQIHPTVAQTLQYRAGGNETTGLLGREDQADRAAQ